MNSPAIHYSVNSPTLVLATNLLQKNRFGVMGAFACIPLIVLALKLAQHYFNLQFVLEPQQVVMPVVFAMLYFSMAFSYADFNKREAQTGFPRHYLLLPVSTLRLVAVPVVLSGAMIVAFLCCYHWLLLVPYGIELPLMALGLGTISILWWIQLIGWGFGHRPIVGMLIFLTSVVFNVGACMVVFQEQNNQWRLLDYLAALVLVLSPVIAVYSSYTAVKRARYGEVLLAKNKQFKWSPPRVRLKKPLANPFTAQVWHEQRCFGWVFPAIILFFATLLTFVFLARTPSFEKVLSLLGMFMAMVVMSPVLVGIEMAKAKFGERDIAMSSYFLTRPLSAQGFAFAKLWVGFKSMAIAWVLLMAGLYLVSNLWIFNTEFAQLATKLAGMLSLQLSPWWWLACYALLLQVTWIMLACQMSVALIGSKRLSYVLYFLVYQVMLASVLIPIYLKETPEQLQVWMSNIIEYAPNVVIGLIAIVTLVLGWIVRIKRQQIPAIATLLSVFAGSAAVTFIGLTLIRGTLAFSQAAIIVMVLVGLFTVLPLVAAPLAFQRQRGR